MMNTKAFLWLICLATLFVSCKKENIESKKDFEKSYQKWLNFKKTSNDSYQYTVGGGSWTGIGWTTIIVVKEGKVTKRDFKYIIPTDWSVNIPDDKKQWTENETEINTHEDTPAAEGITLDEVYKKAKNFWLRKRNDVQVYFEAKNNGLISSCGFVPNGCQDDCFNGITIFSIE
ncbi:MAG: hypothetical protein ACTHK0_14245 [Ginsengibacter sp.]